VSDVSKDLIVFRFRMNECKKCLTLQIKAIGYLETPVRIYRATKRYVPRRVNIVHIENPTRCTSVSTFYFIFI